MSGIPKDYNAIKISADPITMTDCSDRISDAAQNISTALGDIMTCLSDLRLSWTGDSADVADDFNQRWSKTTGDLYGTELSELVNILTLGGLYTVDPAAEGVIPVVTQGVAKAAQNYANAEGAVKTMFDNLRRGLEATGGSGGSPQSVTDQVSGANKNYHTTAVNEF